jgi:fatty-acyl-CoA synthase
VFGLNAVLAALVAGTPTFMMETFDGAEAAQLIRRHRLTHVFASDEVYERILAYAPGKNPLPSLRVCGYGSFKYGAEDFAVPAREQGIPLTGLYGSSEVQALFSMQPATMPPEQLIKGGGRPAGGPAAEVRIRDIETGELLEPGKSGEIEIRADTNFIGYFNDPEATGKAVHPDGFFCTGDIGYVREDGSFVYETRRGDAIRLGGFLVSPAEIEESLKRLPGVTAAQVVAVNIAGQPRCIAWVIPAQGTVLNEQDLIAAAAANMAPFKVPARVWFTDEFPTTQSSNGVKIQRAKLRDMALERIANNA